MKLPFTRFEIEGRSMLPTFRPGDRVLVWQWSSIHRGDAVVFCKNGMKLIKRAVQKNGDRWLMRGDNLTESTDSLDFGDVSGTRIIGKIVAKY